MKPIATPWMASALLLGLIAACSKAPPEKAAPARSTDPSAPASESAASAPAPPPRPKPPVREGGALVRSAAHEVLYLADEDHSVLCRLPYPLDVQLLSNRIKLPGHPAQVLALADKILVTVRDPGLLMMFSPDEDIKELARIKLPADAWGLAISPDEKTAFVSSAWTHQVSAIDLEENTMKLRWSVDVPREPRGLTVNNDGSAVYISHLVGPNLTKLTGLGQGAPTVQSVALPPDPARTRYNEKLSASLGYSIVLSPDGNRLYTARHALGAVGESAWFGLGTVDVLSTVDDTPVLGPRGLPAFGTLTTGELTQGGVGYDSAGALPTSWDSTVAQPRAMVYRKSTNTILLISEGWDNLTELDAYSVAPALKALNRHVLGEKVPREAGKIQIPEVCGAPTGIALSEDESQAWIYCRSTNDVVMVHLYVDGKPRPSEIMPSVRVTEENTSEQVALGRRLFYNGSESVVSGGLGCAGCHPEGRDDGHVWHEIPGPYNDKNNVFIAGTSMLENTGSDEKINPGVARQTPMIAGRVKAVGPYGWHSESATLVDRIKGGFGLHRWWSNKVDGKTARMRAEPLAAFVREGLVPPPREERELTDEEKRGQELFNSPRTGCATCHVPQTEYTDRAAIQLKQRPLAFNFAEDPNPAFKTPSLLYVVGTPPYYHDGSVATLEDLVRKNYDRMGKTSSLKPEEQNALIAFLKTL